MSPGQILVCMLNSSLPLVLHIWQFAEERVKHVWITKVTKWPFFLQWEPKCGTLDGHGPRQGLKALLEYNCSSRITGSDRHAFSVLLGTQLATASEANFHCHLAVTLIFAQSWYQSRATSRSVPSSNLQITPHDTQRLEKVEKCRTASISHFI